MLYFLNILEYETGKFLMNYIEPYFWQKFYSTNCHILKIWTFPRALNNLKAKTLEW